MKALAGFLVFFGLMGFAVAWFNYAETRPFENEVRTEAVVVDNVRKGESASLNAVVEFTLADGSTQRAPLASDGRIDPGTTLEISYRPDDPSPVRAPSQSFGVRGFAIAFATLAGGVALGIRAFTRPPNQAKILGPPLSDPEALLELVKPVAEHELDDVAIAAFGVRRRRTQQASYVPLMIGLFVTPAVLIGVASLINNDFLGRAAVSFLMLAVLASVMAPIVQTRGAVAVTASEFALLKARRGDLSSATVVSRVPRSTPLPELSKTNNELVTGSPLPFGPNAAGRGWCYHAFASPPGQLGYAELIEDLIADSRYRAAYPNGVSPVLNPSTLAEPNGVALKHRVEHGKLLSPENYLASLDPRMVDLVDETVIAAFPVRSTRVFEVIDRLKAVGRLSVLVSAENNFVVSHPSPYQEPRLVRTFSAAEHGTTTTEALAAQKLRPDRSLGWVEDLVEQLS